MDMCNCLKLPTSRIRNSCLRRFFAVLFVFGALCVGAWAETYYWTGTDTTSPTLWSEANNWRTDTDNPASTVPGASDIVYIRSNTTIDIGSSDVTIDGLSLGNNGLSENFTVTITGDGTLNVTGSHVFTDHDASDQGIVTFRPTNTGDDSKVSTLILNCNVVSSSLAIHSGGRVTIGTGKTAEITSVNMMANNANTPTKLTIQGTLISDSITVANFTNQIIVVNEDAILSTQTISGSEGFITNNGLVITESSVDDLINNSSTGTETTADSDSFIWTGAADSDWNLPGNWFGGSIPGNNDKISIPAVEHNPVIKSGDEVSFDISKINIEENSRITVHGTLNITGDFSIDNKLDTSSEGHLKVIGELSNTSSYSATSLSLECTTLNVSANLECKSISVTGTSTLSNTSGITHLVASGDDGIQFGNAVTVTSTGNQFILGGNVTSTGVVNVDIASGMLNHVEEITGHHKDWGSNLTAVLSANNCTFGMAEGSSYKASVTAPADSNVYFVGSGKFTSLEKTNPSCVTHFGNSGDYSNTFTFDSNISSLGKIVFDSSCSGLNSSDTDNRVTLSGVTGLVNKSEKLTSTLGVDFSFDSEASISSSDAGAGKTIQFKDITFAGTATINENISVKGDFDGTNVTLDSNKSLTFNGTVDQTFTSSFSKIYGKVIVEKTSGTTLIVDGYFATGIPGSFTQTSGNVQFNNEAQFGSYTHTAGGINFRGDSSFGQEVSFDNTDTNPITFTGGTAADPQLISGDIISFTNLSGDYVNIDSTTSVSINNANVKGLKISGIVNMQGTITTIGSEDFVIDFPLLLTDETTIAATGNVVVKNSTGGEIGSIKSSGGSGKNLNLTASEIQIQNGASSGAGLGDSTDGKLGTITINSDLELSADTPFYCDKTIFAGTGNKTLSGTYKLTHIGNLEIPTGKNWTFNNQFDITGNLENNGTADFDKAVSVIGDFSNGNSASSTFTNGLPLTGDFNDYGTSFSGNVTLNGTEDQTFKGGTTAPGYDVILDKSSGNVEFTDALTLNSLDAATNSYTGNITFNGTGAQILTPQTGVYEQITVNKTSDTLTFNGNSQIKTFTHTAGNVTFNGNVTFTDTVSLNSATGKTITFSGGSPVSPHTISGTILSLTNLTGDYVSITAATSLAINGANIAGLSIASTIPEIKMQGTVNISGTNDFIIDYPLLLSGTTSLTAVENIKIQNSTDTPAKIGSINSENNACRLSLQTTGTGKTIQIQNGTSEGAGLGTTKQLSTITINSSLDLTKDTTFKTSGTNGTTFAGTGTLGGTGGTLTTTGNFRNNGTWTINRPVIVTGNLSNLTGKTVTFKENVSVTGNVTDSGTWNSDDGKKLIFNGTGTGTQTFTPVSDTTYKLIEVNKSAGSFSTASNKELKVANFTLTACPVTIFNGVSTFTTFNSNAATGTITFANDTTIKSDTEFKTTETVTFSNGKAFAFDDGTSKHTVEHTAGTSYLTGAITSQKATFGTTVLSAATTINGESQFDGTIDGAFDLTTNGTATFNDEVGTTTALASLSTKSAEINCTSITTTGTQIYDGEVSLLKDGNITLLAKDGATYQTVTFTNTVDCNGATGTPNLIIDAKTKINGSSITTTGTQKYKSEVTIDNITSVISLEGSSISFDDKIIGSTGNQGLALTAGTITFGDQAADTVTALASLAVNGNAVVNTNTITTDGTQTYTGTITLNENVTLETETTSSITFGTDILGSGKTLAVNSPKLISSKTAGTTANITLNELTVSRNIQISSTDAAGLNLDVSSITGTNKTLTFDGYTTQFILKDGINIEPNIENNKTISCAGAATFNGTVTNSGTITCNSTVTFKDTFTNTNGSISGDTTDAATLAFEKDYSGTGTSSLTASKGQTIFYGNVDLSETNFAHSDGSVILSAPSGSGTTTATLNTGTGKAFNNLNLERQVEVSGTGTGNTIAVLIIKDSVKLLCNNTITTFTADTPVGETTGSGLGGKTITFGDGKKQTISGILTLKGSDNIDNKRLSLVSFTPGNQWKIKCTGANEHTIQYVDIKDGWNISETGTPTEEYNLFALNSNDSGNNKNWNFPGMNYLWKTTATSTDWNTASNWEQNSIPGKGAVIEIPAGCAKYPELTTELNLNASYGSPAVEYKGKITIAANAKFDLADQKLTTGEIINNGLVSLKGSQAIIGTMKNGEDGQKGTVEYYDDDPNATLTSFVWDGDSEVGKKYYNLIINKNINQSSEAGEQIKVSGTTTISAGNGKTVTLNNASNVFTGAVKAGDSTTTPAVNAGAVTLKATSPITLVNNANADSLEVQSAVKLQNVTTSGNQSYTGSVETLSGAGTVTIKSTTGNIGFGNPVSLGVQTSVITSTADKTIAFGTAATINGAQSLSLSSSGGTTFGANVGNTTPLSALSVSGPLTVSCASIKTSGNQTYNNITLTSAPTFTVSGADNKIDFNGSITGSVQLTSAGSGSANFNNTVNVASLETQKAKINTSSITTSSGQVYKDSVILAADATLSSTTDGDITFESPLDGDKILTLSVPLEKSITFTGQLGASTTIANPPSITIAQANNISFSETVKANAISLTKASSTTFVKAVDITTFSDDSTNHTGTVRFSAGGTIHNNVIFNTNNPVSFNGTMNIGTASPWANLKHVNGSTFITGTLTAADIDLAASSANGTINATTTQTGNLTLAGDTTITTSGTQNYTGTINDTTASAGTHSLTLNSGTAQISFTGDIGQTAALSKLTVNGPIAINCATVTTANEQNYNAAVTSTGSIALHSAAINLNCSTVSTNGTQVYDGVVTLLSDTALTSDTGDLNFTKTLTGEKKLTIVKTNDASFEEAVNVSALEITSANDTEFESTTTSTSFKITQATTTTFDDAVTIGSFTDTANAGDITFKNGGTISNSTGTSFITSGTVTFGDNQSDIMNIGSTAPYVNLTHTSGNTSITGTLNTAELTLANISGGPMTLSNSGLFTTTDGSALTYTAGFSQTGTGNSKLGGSFTGNGNAAFATDLQLYGSSQADFGFAGKTINVSGNLIVVREASDELSILSNVTVAENLVLYKGAVTAAADLSAGKDILILGSTYSTTDTSTGITDEYAYTVSRHAEWSQPNYTESLLPDGSALPASSAYSATLSVTAGKTISAAKNFYANGTQLSLDGTSGQWLLCLPDITNPANGFAEAYHSVVSGCKVTCTDGSTNGSKARLVVLERTDSGNGTSTPNTNVELEDFQITKAYTVRDNAIRVEFNQPIRYHASTINQLNFHDANDSVTSDTRFTGFYSDPDCQHELTSDITQSYTDESSGKIYWYFYIKATPQDSASTGAWNTDATGKSSGAANGKSSDRNGIHHTALPCLDFPRALSGNGTTASLPFIITDRWGKRLNNYSRRVPKAGNAEAAYGSKNSSDTAFEVADKTGPVMWTVRTGQELHNAYNAATGEAGQHSYDSHNFLEFRYSEPVDFTPLTSGDTENIRVTNDFGAIKEANINQKADSLTFAGIAQFTAPAGSKLLLHTGYNGTTSKYMNALYRTDEYSLRLSLAGWTDGTVTDYSGNEYKNWTGYIEGATQFTGAKVKPVMQGSTQTSNPLIIDLEGNAQIEYAINKIEPQVYSDSSSENTSHLLPLSPDLYSTWDISEPVFTPLRFSVETAWGENEFSEAIGNTNGSGSTLDRIDFHFFDNTPTWSNADTAEWFTETGWCIPGSEGTKDYLYDSSYTYAADIIGGARQFDSVSARRTAGGIRLSTKLNAAQGFKYSTDPEETQPATEFAPGKANVHSTVISQLFTGSSEPQHSANDPDGLYLGLGITDTSLPVETSFAFSYNASAAYLTDLAGNRLRNKTSRTIDRTPPSFDIILSPVDQKQIYIVFVKEIVTKSSDIDFRNADGSPKDVSATSSTENFFTMLPACFKLIKINSDGSFTPSTEIQIDSSVPAKLVSKYSDRHFTCVSMTLTKEITYDDLKSLYVQLSHHPDFPETSPDPYTSNSNARVTFIQDYLGNYMQMYSAHALSDFAIGLVNPLYAYSSDITENDEPVMSGLYNEGSWAVHDWNADQKNYGTLPAAHSAAIVTQQVDGTEDGSELPENVRIYLSNSPDTGSVSTQFNKDFGTSLRVWLPDLTDGIFRSLSAKNNSNWSFIDSESLEEGNFSNLIFNIPLEMINTWKSGDQISFIFGITESNGSPVKIYNSPYYDTERKRYDFALSTAVPLYALRMHDVTDIGSLDLWSFRLKGITSQRGGVTILNNVINASHGEKTVIKVDVPTEGKLNVIVMTLDGNIITYLHRGNAKAGENYFTWDGKNRNGSLVARGMYFVRVVGSDFDETRKVMVVK